MGLGFCKTKIIIKCINCITLIINYKKTFNYFVKHLYKVPVFYNFAQRKSPQTA